MTRDTLKMDMSYAPQGFSPSKVKEKKLYTFDKDMILRRQKNFCAGKDCKKLHNGKKLFVNIMSNFDHIEPRALGGKTIPSNIQALCANCHQLKTREDRKRIAIFKKKKEESSSFGNLGF